MNPQALYEKFAENFDYDPGEEKLPPWSELSDAIKDQWLVYAAELEGLGEAWGTDPDIILKNKPRA